MKTEKIGSNNLVDFYNDIETEIKFFIKKYNLTHFDTVEILNDKDSLHSFDVLNLNIHTTRFPRVLHYSNHLKLKYHHDILNLQAKPTEECINQIKVALLIY